SRLRYLRRMGGAEAQPPRAARHAGGGPPRDCRLHRRSRLRRLRRCGVDAPAVRSDRCAAGVGRACLVPRYLRRVWRSRLCGLWAYQIVVVAIAIALALDLMLGRWVSAAVTRLIVDLGEAAETGTLRDRLAGALGDRSLALGFWLPERGVYVDERGRELELSEM